MVIYIPQFGLHRMHQVNISHIQYTHIHIYIDIYVHAEFMVIRFVCATNDCSFVFVVCARVLWHFFEVIASPIAISLYYDYYAATRMRALA